MRRRALSLAFLLLAARLGAADWKALRSELAELAAREDGSASPENLAVLARARAMVAEAAAVAERGGEDAGEAWAFLEDAWRRRERNVAMEAALALIGSRDREGVRRLLRSAREADAAVRRQAFRTLASTARGAAGAFAELAAALESEKDAESALALVDLVRRAGTLEAARALLGRSRSAPLELREAIAGALAEFEAPEVAAWLRSGAFLESRDPSSLRVAARVAASRKDPAARGPLEDLLGHEDTAVAAEALEALAALGPEESLARIADLAKQEGAPPELAASAAVVLASADREAGTRALLDLAGRASWAFREAAARALPALAGEERAFRKCIELLRDPNREVRAAAFAALPSFRRKEAISAAIALLDPFGGSDSGRALAYLERTTGRRLGKDRAAWLAWWREAEPGFRFPDPELAKEDRPGTETKAR